MLSIGHQHWLHTNLIAGSYSNIVDPFRATFDIKRPLLDLDFNQAADYTAELIANKYANLHLCLSGGLDSEFVASVLIRNKIPFVPVIVLTESNSENWYAFKFCHKHGLTPIVFDFSNKTAVKDTDLTMGDLLTEIYRIAVTLTVPTTESLIPNVIVKLLADPTAKVLTGYGEPYPNPRYFGQAMGRTMEICDHDYYLDLEYNDHPSGFFVYTPEIFKAMITEIDYTLNTQIAKAQLYGLLPRCKSNSILEYIKLIKENSSKHISDLNKKFWRAEHLKTVNIDRQTLLSML